MLFSPGTGNHTTIHLWLAFLNWLASRIPRLPFQILLHWHEPALPPQHYFTFWERFPVCWRNHTWWHQYIHEALRRNIPFHLSEHAWHHLQNLNPQTHSQFTTITLSLRTPSDLLKPPQPIAPYQIHHALVSPVFPPISHQSAYQARLYAFPPEEWRHALQQAPFPVIALGGITPERIPLLLQIGFHGIALRGYLWSAGTLAASIQRYLQVERVLSTSIA